MKLRNDFLYYLVLNAQEGELRPPFNEAPPNGPLLELAKMLVSINKYNTILLYYLHSFGNVRIIFKPTGAEAQLEGAGKWAEGGIPVKSQKPMLYSYSPDGGAFLAAQPIPRCGAFCYLAVVSRSKE